MLSLREKEFIEAARMVGASDARIMRSHLLPHLVAPIIVLLHARSSRTNVLFEAGLSFLGVGIQCPTPSWGNLLSSAPDYYTDAAVADGLARPGGARDRARVQPPGRGLRDAFDPRST